MSSAVDATGEPGPARSGRAQGSAATQLVVLTLFALIVLGPVWVWFWVLGSCFLFPLLLPLWICYVTYINTAGFKAAEGMSWEKQRWGVWKHMRDYFPARLHKTADLDPKKTYIFALVPHGVIGLSSWLHFGVEVTGFHDLFPGISMRVLTLKHFLLTPVIREIVLASGLRLASRPGIKRILGSGPGSAVLIVPGGAAEALLAAPGTMDLVTAKRKGFVKLAIETGSSLVPVVAFGENEAFDTHVPKKGSRVDALLKRLKKTIGFSTPLYLGVGYWPGSWGTLPKRTPLDTVVGAPIDVPKYEAESKQDEKMTALVDEYHAKFLAAVQKLWDEHKDKYAVGRKSDLCFVEEGQA